MTAQVLSTALIQHAMSDDLEKNMETSCRMIAQAATLGAKLIVLPELHRSPYFCKSQNPAFFEYAEPLRGPTFQTLSKEAAANGVVLVGSIFEARQPGLAANTAIVVDTDGELAGHYRKMHIPDDPGYNEKFYFAPGDLGFRPIDTSLGKLGVLVCWDQWFPEAARLMALAGAQVLIYPTAIGWDISDSADVQQRQLDAWRIMHQSHAIANGIPVLACNRIGHEADPNGNQHPAKFWGHSLITGPQGEILTESEEDEAIVMWDLNFNQTAEVRRMWPFLRDRRIDAYDGLLSRSLCGDDK